jgi:hypothetical protein
MRSSWSHAASSLVLTSALALGACAQGTTDDAPGLVLGDDGGTGVDASGATTQATGDDASATAPPPGTGDDASGAGVDGATPGDDGGGSGADAGAADSAPVVDSGGTPGSGTSCPVTFQYATEWSQEFSSGNWHLCAAGKDCTATECCYQALPGLCVAL